MACLPTGSISDVCLCQSIFAIVTRKNSCTTSSLRPVDTSRCDGTANDCSIYFFQNSGLFMFNRMWNPYDLGMLESHLKKSTQTLCKESTLTWNQVIDNCYADKLEFNTEASCFLT